MPTTEFHCRPAAVIAEKASRDVYGHFKLPHLVSTARADVYLAGRDPLAQRGLAGRVTIELVTRHVPIATAEYVILHTLGFRQQGASQGHT